MKKKLLYIALIFLSINAFSQVGIGNTAPNGALDISSTNDGLLIPRIALAATTTATVITPTVSELVYNTATSGVGPLQVTPGYYYWDGAQWVRLATGAASPVAWSILGNTGTLPATNFIGTTDNQDFVVRSNNTERLRVKNDGSVGIGTTTPRGAFEVNSSTQGIVIPTVALVNTTTETAINPQGGAIPAGTIVYNSATSGVAPNNVGPGLYFWNGARWISFAGSPGGLDWSLTGNTGTTPGTNFIGTTDNQDFVVRSNNARRLTVSSTGDISIGTNTVTGDNVFEVFSVTDGEDAVNGYATGSGIGVFGTTTGDGLGIFGSVNSANAIAVYAINADIGGTGIVAAGGNSTANFYPGSGVSGNGPDTGVAGIAKTVTTGVGVRGNGNGVTSNTTSGVGAGVSGSGTQVGVFGHASNLTGIKNGGVFSSEHGGAGTADNPYAYLAGSDGSLVYGGYFDANQDNNNNNSGQNQGEDYAYVGVVNGITTYKILGTGSVSTMVKDENNERRILFAPEAPEILFQDYGVGQLNNGVAEIKIDPILTKNIFVDDKHPLKVFVQLEGDCKGVYVTNKSANGFTVKELQNGNSNVSFSWQIVANRTDMLDANGNVHSKHVDVRFPIGPGPIKHEQELKTEIIKSKVEEKK